MAARRHWRFVVRDQYGYVIQNAKVNVYLPGTTTVFAGTAYDAASGGGTVTNPFTTNAFGEVEAWFDTAQVVDVEVNDNTNTAYRAVGGASDLVDFSAFTEKDDIYVSASDQFPDDADLPTSVGEAGDIGANIADPFTTVSATAGSTTEWADAGHRHPFTGLSPAAPEIPLSTASAGTSTNPARADHKHKFPAAVGKTSKFTSAQNTNEQVIHTSHTIPANSMTAGSMWRISMYGYQTNSTTGMNWTFRVRWGTGGVVVGTAIVFASTTTAHTDNPVQLEFLMTVQSIGASGTATGSWFGSECFTTATANTPKLVLDVQAAAATIDTTASKVIELSFQLSATTGAPQLEVDNVVIEQVA